MPDSPQITYAPGLEDLTGALEELQRPGDYVASGTVACAPPLMEVDGVGIVSFPVPTEQARALAAAAERAPYGRGNQTLLDESVRKVRQISPCKVKIGGKQWPLTLASILAAATEGLGRPKDSLQADLYKLLVYETGGFFLPHRDTEKAPGMLGTLIVVLPSAHEGGELIVRHNGRERALDLRNLDPGELRYAPSTPTASTRCVRCQQATASVWSTISSWLRRRKGRAPPFRTRGPTWKTPQGRCATGTDNDPKAARSWSTSSNTAIPRRPFPLPPSKVPMPRRPKS